MPKKYPHLEGAQKLASHPGQRLCVHLNAGLVMDLPGAILCFGTFRASTPEEMAADPNASPTPFIHAWTEYKGMIYSATAMATCPIAEYYEVNGAKNVRKLDRPRLLKLAKEIGLSRHLRLGVPTKGNVSVGGTLLDAVGYRYQTEGAALLPMEGDNG